MFGMVNRSYSYWTLIILKHCPDSATIVNGALLKAKPFLQATGIAAPGITLSHKPHPSIMLNDPLKR